MRSPSGPYFQCFLCQQWSTLTMRGKWDDFQTLWRPRQIFTSQEKPPHPQRQRSQKILTFYSQRNNPPILQMGGLRPRNGQCLHSVPLNPSWGQKTLVRSLTLSPTNCASASLQSPHLQDGNVINMKRDTQGAVIHSRALWI